MPITINDFLTDHQGRRYADVVQDSRIDFGSVLEFFSRPAVVQRLVDSEIHHDRPALAGAIRELEAQPNVASFFANNDAHTTTRFRQSIGVVTRIIMESRGFRTSGRKQSVGVRGPVRSGSRAAGAYQNVSGISRWFTRSERYVAS